MPDSGTGRAFLRHHEQSSAKNEGYPGGGFPCHTETIRTEGSRHTVEGLHATARSPCDTEILPSARGYPLLLSPISLSVGGGLPHPAPALTYFNCLPIAYVTKKVYLWTKKPNN